MKKHSIKHYLTAHIVGWSIAMTLIPAIWVYHDTSHEVEELFDASLAQSARVLHGLLTRESVSSAKPHLISSLLGSNQSSNAFHSYEKKVSFQVVDQDSVILKSYSAPNELLSKLEPGYHYHTTGPQTWRTFSFFSEEDNWWLLVAEDIEIRDELTHYIARDHALPLLIFTPLLVLVVWFTIKKGLMPLSQAAHQVNKQDYGQLKQLKLSKNAEEVASLVDAINDLFTRLDEAHERERRFTSNAAHELRTPLASLMIHTENIIEENNDPEIEPSLVGMKQGISRISHLLSQLLSLSRADADLLEQDFSECNINEILTETCSKSRAISEQKNQTLQYSLPSKITTIKGNHSLLQSMFQNVVANAIKYTPDGGSIDVELQPDGEIRIQDNGPGVPEELIDQVKDRFFRVQNSGQEGSGLGLTIVDRVAEIHGIKWELKNSKNRGLLVTFKLA